MRYLIDGYNLFFNIQKSVLPLQQKREKFLEDLDREIALIKMDATLVFDSNQEHTESFPSSKKMQALEVVFSPKHLSADAYILELLSWNSHNTTLVTSDRELSLKATHLGATTQPIEEFIALLLKRGAKKTAQIEEKVELRESNANMQRLLKIFEKKLRDDENA
ncbi:MAG: hypothetical protein K1060chlam2_00908 [Chlamydiae bacterium]|nr:hypothetical protein [Chlamydiota bacterium]